MPIAKEQSMDNIKEFLIISSAVVGLIAGCVTLYAHFRKKTPVAPYPSNEFAPTPTKNSNHLLLPGVFAGILTLICCVLVIGLALWMGRRRPQGSSSAPVVSSKPQNSSSERIVSEKPTADFTGLPGITPSLPKM